MPDHSTTALLRAIRLRAFLPTTPALGTTDEELLSLATDELQLQLASDIKAAREEFWEDTQDIAIVAGQAWYPVPSRAIAGTLRKLWLVDSAGELTELEKIEPDEVADYSQAAGEPCRYYLRSGEIILHPAPSAAGESIRVLFERRPAGLVKHAPSTVGRILTTTAGTISLEGSAFSGLKAGARVDIVRAVPHFDVLLADALVSGVAAGASQATVVHVTSTVLTTKVSQGDYLTLAGTSPVPQIPLEHHSLLAQRCACTVLRNLGSAAKLQMAEAALKAMEKAAELLIEPRTSGDVETLDGSELFGGW